MTFGIFAGATNIAYKYMLVAKFVCTPGYIAGATQTYFTFSKTETHLIQHLSIKDQNKVSSNMTRSVLSAQCSSRMAVMAYQLCM